MVVIVSATKASYVAPTIFTGVKNEMRISQEEIFGPVASVISFEDEEEAVAIAEWNCLQSGCRCLEC